MNDNPIVLDINDPLFLKRENWLKKKLSEALDGPFITFEDAIKKCEMGIYFIYNANELLYVGMTTRPGHNRIKEILKGFRKHTFSRKLMAAHFRGRGYHMHVLSTKNYKRDWIDSQKIKEEEFIEVELEVRNAIKRNLRFKFFEFNYINLNFLEHYAIATLQPLYND